MPTPFYHLGLAEGLLQHPSLPEGIRHFLHASRPAFLFGNTAPDVQVVSGQPREQTHFFSLPILPEDPPAWELFLAQNSSLAEPGHLTPSQVAFLTGYLCHLQADWLWIKEIFAPVFGPRCSWGTFQERLYLHNVLRAYLDRCILPKLCEDIATCLQQVKPAGWLPFVKSRYLVEWRNYLSPQMQPGAVTQTVEVFSSRQGRSAHEFYALLASEERMQQEVFTHLSPGQVESYHQRVLEENVQLISAYLAFTRHDIIAYNNRSIYHGAQPLN